MINRTPGAETLAREFLESLGLSHDGKVEDKFLDHLFVMLEALQIHMDREAAYGDLWVKNGGVDNFQNAGRKVRRQLAVLMIVTEDSEPVLHKDNLDDAFDAINYAAFGIRNIRNLNFDGDGQG